MSMFRKPKKPIQRRVFTAADGDEDDADMDTDGLTAPPPPRIRDKPGREKEQPKQTLLSFADEEDDGEVFRVKKSSQSKRLARTREKERRRTTPAAPGAVSPPHVTNSRDLTSNDKNEANQSEVRTRRRSVEGLILSGRAALAADGLGDVEDEDAGEHDDAGFHTYRPESVRAALTSGQIPDAALIHAARKTRQQARETGRGDYIPLSSGGGGGGAPGGGGGSAETRGVGSRLVREDGSGDDEEEERIAVRGVIDNTRQDERDAGADSGAEEWEEQQLQKAVSAGAAPDSDGMQLNLFGVAPPPAPRLDDAPPHLRPLELHGARDAASLRAALEDRLSDLRRSRAAAAAETTGLRGRLLAAMRTRESRTARAPDLDAAYRRAQAARSYFTDLIECIDEKLPELQALEARARQLHKRRCSLLAERRRADTRDQAQDVLSLAARPGVARAPDSEEKVRRAAEREGRRRARRLAREHASSALAAQHREGDSSDDELPHSEREHQRAEREAIARLSSQLFADTLPEWGSVRGVCRHVARWRRSAPQAYRDAYVQDCLPRLLAPYVRAEIVLWNPLADEDNEDYEKMDWYKCLVMYGVRRERGDRDSEPSDGEGAPGVSEPDVERDPDLMLAPGVVARVLLPKITELVETAWDPMCVRATTRLRALLLRACSLPPRALPSRERLAGEVRARLAAAVGADVFLPALPPPIMDGAGGAFWRRCLGAGVRLLRATLALCPPPDVLNADPLALRLVGTLCTAAGAAPPTASAQAASALASTLPRGASRLRKAALQRIAALARAARVRLQHDNPLHLKALEQVRAVLAEAKSEGISAIEAT